LVDLEIAQFIAFGPLQSNLRRRMIHLKCAREIQRSFVPLFMIVKYRHRGGWLMDGGMTGNQNLTMPPRFTLTNSAEANRQEGEKKMQMFDSFRRKGAFSLWRLMT
jgi:hypothetical protein